MTLNDIIVNALRQLDRGHDSQTLDVWRDKLTSFANDGMQDIAKAISLFRTDELAVLDGEIDLMELPRVCEKIRGISQNGRPVKYQTGSATDKLAVNAAGMVQIAYCYCPKALSSPSDEPELPAFTHALIVTYAVARERASQDTTVQRGSSVYFELYNKGKYELRKHRGEQDQYKIVNRW